MTGTSSRVCTRCVMDTTDPRIVFDAAGICSHCTQCLDRLEKQLLPPAQREDALGRMIALIQREGVGKDCDCIVGVSGGVDSTMVVFAARQFGLRPLAVHFDNGWNSELAVDNIKRALDTLGVELFTYVVDWDEFRDVQLSFLRASVPNCEIPTDHGITATLFHAARRFRTRFILSGSNLASESILPIAWGHYNQDLRHLKAVHRRFGSTSLRTLPTLSLCDYLIDVFGRRIRQVPFLNYIDYDKKKAKDLLARELGWRDYGGKHYESIWTRFFQGYYLPMKFGFDKRRAHFSSLICSGGMTREEALAALSEPPYEPAMLAADRAYVLKKLNLTEDQFNAILSTPPAQHTSFPSHAFLFETLGYFKHVFRAIATTP